MPDWPTEIPGFRQTLSGRGTGVASCLVIGLVHITDSALFLVNLGPQDFLINRHILIFSSFAPF